MILFKEKLTCGFKCDMRNLVNFGEFSPNHSKVWKSIFDWLCLKYSRFELQKYREIIFPWHWTVTQTLNKPWPCDLKNSMGNWVGFHESTQKSEKLYFDWLFLSKRYNVSATKFHRNYISWHWRVMQKLKENWFTAWKMT